MRGTRDRRRYGRHCADDRLQLRCGLLGFEVVGRRESSAMSTATVVASSDPGIAKCRPAFIVCPASADSCRSFYRRLGRRWLIFYAPTLAYRRRPDSLPAWHHAGRAHRHPVLTASRYAGQKNRARVAERRGITRSGADGRRQPPLADTT